jgi:hypothetical protein
VTDDLRNLIDGLAPALAAVFLAAIALLRKGVNYKLLIVALQNGDMDAAIAALNLDAGAFSHYVLERQAAYLRAGTKVSELLTDDRAGALKKVGEPTARAPGGTANPRDMLAPPGPSGLPSPAAPGSGSPPPPPGDITLTAPGGGEITFRFDMTNPRAEQIIRTQAASRVVGYVDEQIEAARKIIADGFERGEGPQSIATDIAGRVNPISGKREGGIIGLSDPQVSYVQSMKARLLSGDADEMVKVLGGFDKDGKWVPGTGMTLRDRRYDAKIKAAIKAVAAGKPNPLSDDTVTEMTAKYSDRLLKRRAEDISRTETAQGVMLARSEATKQALNKSGLPDNAVEKFWRHNGGVHHARNWHLAMNNKSVVGIDMPFHLPDGSTMLHSHDPAGGVRNNVSCRCSTDFDVDWAHGLI